MTDTSKKLLTQKEYADHLGISQPAVSKMIRAGRIPAIHGRIDAAAADLALAGEANSGGITLAEAQRRKEAALAKLRELEYETRSAKVCDVEHVCEVFGRHFLMNKTMLLAFPTKLVGVLGGSDYAKRVIFAEATRVIHELLHNMADLTTTEERLCPQCEERVKEMAAQMRLPADAFPDARGVSPQ